MTMRVLKYASVPGLPPTARPYEFQLIEEELRLEIPAERHGPDVAIALDPEQERWLDRRPELRRTWDCQWTFLDAAALAYFLAELGPPWIDPATLPAALPDGDRQVVLEGGAPGNWVEVARAGDIVVSCGMVEGRDEPWDIVARRAPDLGAFDALVAHWSRDFPIAVDRPAPRAYFRATVLGHRERLWVRYRFGGIDGVETCRILDLGDRVALETLGAQRTLAVFATLDEAMAKTGPRDVACGLDVPHDVQREAILALGPPRARPPRRARRLKPDATLPARLAEAFRRLEAAGVLAMPRVAGPRSHAWGKVDEARRREHAGCVFFLADHWRELDARAALDLYWASWNPEADAFAFALAIVETLAALGIEATAPPTVDSSIAIHLRSH